MSSSVHERAVSRLVRLEGPVLQCLDLAAPWCVRVDGCSHPGMYVVHRGSARIDVFGESLQLEVGDCVLLPRGAGQHVVGDTLGTAPLQSGALAAREVPPDERSLHVDGPGPRARLSAIPFRSSPLAWLPRVLLVRKRDRDPVGESLFAAYERALEHGEGDVVARITEAMWIRFVADRLPQLQRLDAEVLRAAAMVLDAPATPHTLGSLARAACLSRSRFSARFRAAFGEPPMRWVQSVRMEHANWLLRDGTMSIAAVADLLGWSDESAFRKAYRRIRDRAARGDD